VSTINDERILISVAEIPPEIQRATGGTPPVAL